MVMRTDKVRVVMQVPEGDAPLIKDGADAMVTIPALRNREVACTVTRGSYALDTESRTLRVEIFLDNPLKDPKEEMLPGTYVSVRIVADVPNVMCVPSDAIQIKGGSNYCFVVEDGKAKRVNVRTGVQNDHLIRVLYKQLPPAKEDEPGDWVPFTGKEQVILSPLHLVQEGQVVTVKAVEELKDEKRETHTEKH
jgi:multidrug efflux pump subunit AcrA (membrane-fusion protein)